MATPPLLALKDLHLSFGAKTLFDGIDLAIGARERLCLVGRNGTGKSTLMKVVAGQVEPDQGERFVQPGVTSAYLAQEPDAAGHSSVGDYLASGLPAGEEDATHKVAAALEEIAVAADADPQALSGGELRRCAIMRAFLAAPDILLMDEPTNHLDLPTIEWLETKLAASRAALVLISHDRAFLNRLTSACLWLDRGRLDRLNQGFAAFEDWAARKLEQEAAGAAKLDKLITEETRWSREGITARRKRNQGRLRRLNALREERRQRIPTQGRAAMTAQTGKTSGKLVIEADAVAKRFGERTILTSFSTRILRGDRVGIIGPNGAGKTTLLNMLIGRLPPDGGTVRLGTNLQMLVIDQKRAALDPERSLWETMTGGTADQLMVRGRPTHVVSYLRDFLFAAEQARAPVGSLSGGEKNRLLLAQALARPSNLMVLDEPTNDLDMDTLDLLQEVLSDYEGTVLLVSHDRDFLDRLVTSTIALEGDGTAVEYAGGYSDYLDQRPARGRPAAKPKKKPAPGPEKTAAPKAPERLSYKHKRTLETLPGEMAALEDEIAALERAVADSGAYARDPKTFTLATERLDAARQALAAKEEEWLTLEMMREELEGS